MKRRNFFLFLAAVTAPVRAVFVSAKPSNGVPIPAAPYTEWFEMTLRPNKADARLYDLLVRRYRKGTTNPGQGTKLMGSSAFYAADRDGERIQRVRARLIDLYAKHPDAAPVAEDVRSVIFTTLCHNARLRAQHANVKAFRARMLGQYG